MDLRTHVQRHTDRVSVSFTLDGVSDHDAIVTVTLDLRLAANGSDEELRNIATKKLREFALSAAAL